MASADRPETIRARRGGRAEKRAGLSPMNALERFEADLLIGGQKIRRLSADRARRRHGIGEPTPARGHGGLVGPRERPKRDSADQTRRGWQSPPRIRDDSPSAPAAAARRPSTADHRG